MIPIPGQISPSVQPNSIPEESLCAENNCSVGTEFASGVAVTETGKQSEKGGISFEGTTTALSEELVLCRVDTLN